MMLLLWACSGMEYAVPEATVFLEEEEWKGSLSFVQFVGDKEQCRMDYSLESGEEKDCTSCSWEVLFQLEALSEPCVFSSLERLSFLVDENQDWWVLEENGWEHWGTVQAEEQYWEFISAYRFLD